MKVSLLADNPSVAPQIARWYFNEWAHNVPEATIGNITDKVLSGANTNTLPIVFIVRIEGELIGVGELKSRELAQYPGLDYWLDGIYVPETHRGKGISRLLIQFAESKAKELQLPALYLRCEEHNVKLYESHGYRVISQEQDRFIMELGLSL